MRKAAKVATTLRGMGLLTRSVTATMGPRHAERNGYIRLIAAVAAWAVLTALTNAADWPTWRYDAARTAASPEPLPPTLHPAWVRHLPPPRPAFTQVRQQRQQFDLGYESVVAGKTLLVGLSSTDCVLALDTETGAERWRFYTDGPVRLAPAVSDGKAYVGSDDGHLVCLDVADGRLVWKLRASPSPRTVLGSGRLISAWPVRGGPIVADGTVYFAAGVWPGEGIFVVAADAETGAIRWVNDRSGCLYAQHPHGAMAFGGPSPMGYLLIREGEVLVPSGRAFPAAFDRTTGELIEFEFGHGGHGSRPGGWFLATGADGRLVVDPAINTETHDAGQQRIGQHDIRPQPDEVLQEQIRVGTRTYEIRQGAGRRIVLGGAEVRFDDPPVAVQGTVHSIVAAGGRLFVTTRHGTIHCFGPDAGEPETWELPDAPLETTDDRWADEAQDVLTATRRTSGYALVWGLSGGRLVEELLRQTDYHVIAVDPDAATVEELRRRLDAAGLYGSRASVHVGDPLDFAFPPYLAELVASEDLSRLGDPPAKSLDEAVLHVLHPFGGAACFESADQQHAALAASLDGVDPAGVELVRNDGHSVFLRPGPLPGAADYAGEQNFDRRVKAPLGLLWFGDTFHHHKLFYRTFEHETGRGLPTEITVTRGVMKYAATREPYGPNPKGVSYFDYLRLLEREKTYFDAYTDVYTGRVLAVDEVADIPFPSPVQRPAAATTRPPAPAVRKNPITHVAEARAMLKTYGCDRNTVDYGRVLTYRSGTAAFYDKRCESGTINVGGVRSGCRNSMVPAAGVLALPSWTGNCTCNYPVYTSLALVPVPEEHEQWSAWGDVAVEGPVERVGINFGAPGDRAAADGTLWLDWPSVGGPSPQVRVEVAPEGAEPFYRHALWIRGGEGPPWVAASGIRGVRSIRIEPVVLRSDPPSPAISVRWSGSLRPQFSETYTFTAETDHGVRLWIGDALVIDNGKDLRRGEVGEVSATVDLEAGVRVPITLEYYQAKDGQAATGTVRLLWQSPSVAKAVVPAAALSTPDGQPGGLVGAYYDAPDFSGPVALRTDATIDFRWAGKRPQPLVRWNDSQELPERAFTVRLHFAEPEDVHPGDRVFAVRLQGKPTLDALDIVREAGAPSRSIVRQFEGVRIGDSLTVELVPATDRPAIISGIELIAEPAPK